MQTSGYERQDSTHPHGFRPAMNSQRLTIFGLIAVAVMTATVLQAVASGTGPGGATGSLAQAPAPASATRATSPDPTSTSTAGVAAVGERIWSGDLTVSTPTSGTVPSAAVTARIPVTPSPGATATTPPTATREPTPRPAAPVRSGRGAVPAVNARQIAVIDEASGALLYEKAPYARVAPASLTKIVTAVVAIDASNPKQVVKVRFDATELVDSTLMGLRVGDEVTLEDLLYGLMLPSGNDAALAIAEHVAGSKPAFVDMMNAKVQELGLVNSQFRNPHGLDEKGHYTSAYDITWLARYGMTRQPLFVQLAKARVWEVRGSRSWEVYNLNKFLTAYREKGADGVKIGYTDDAGRTIVASASRNGHRVYVTLMGCGDIVADTTPLFDWVFANYTWP
jgi:D-alanyl-D-alanine carboxypeptidase